MTDWAKLKVVDLKAELKRRELPQHGLKADLVERLSEADNTLGSEAAGPDSATEDGEEVTQAEAEPEGSASLTEPEEQDGSALAIEQNDAAQVTTVDGEHQADSAVPPSEAEASLTMDGTTDPSEVAPEQGQTATTLTPVASTVVEIPPESPNDTLKRKRRSPSPPQDETFAVRKRAKAEEVVQSEIAPGLSLPEDGRQSPPPAAGDHMENDPQPTTPSITNPDVTTTAVVTSTSPPTLQRHDTIAAENPEDVMFTDYNVSPALHPATAALYIGNLMRPMRPNEMQAHLANVAAAPGHDPDTSLITNFWLDPIRTHAYVTFNSSSAASRARAALHDRIWPNESNRKALWVDFIPKESVAEWIEREESSGRKGRGGPTPRWEVVYEPGPDGAVEARLEQGDRSNSRPEPTLPRALANAATDMHAPHGPRNAGPEFSVKPPIGPRGNGRRKDWENDRDQFRDRDRNRDRAREEAMDFDRSPRFPSDNDFNHEYTRAHPSIAYLPVAEDLARRRIANMHSFYTRDATREFGREINRYSFEQGDSFIDRGKEIFEGIRPPHRERGLERWGGGGFRGGGYGGRPPPRRGGGGGGKPPFRSRGDRYFPRGGGGGRFEEENTRDRGWDLRDSRY